MKNLLSTAFLILFMVMGITSVFSQNFNCRKVNKSGILNELNLTETQKELFDDIRFKRQEAKIDIETNLKRNRLEMNKLLINDDLDEKGLMDLINKRSLLRSEMIKSRSKMWLEIRDILDDDQKRIWTKCFSRMGIGMRKEKYFNRNDERFMRNSRQLNSSKRNFGPRKNFRNSHREF